MERLFRILLIFQLLLLTVFFFVPWGFAYGADAEMALTWQGFNALVDEKAIYFSNQLASILYVVSYVGLFFFKNWARMLLLFVSVVGGVCISLYGVSIQSGFESMISYFMTLIDGALIVMSFLTSVHIRFNGETIER